LERKPKPRSIGGDVFITPTKRMVGLATAFVTFHDFGLGHAGNEHRPTAGHLMTHDPSLIGIGDEVR